MRKEEILLEAAAAALPRHELVKQIVKLERDFLRGDGDKRFAFFAFSNSGPLRNSTPRANLAQQDAEILKRNAGDNEKRERKTSERWLIVGGCC